jgi:signal transduction histidine kinase
LTDIFKNSPSGVDIVVANSDTILTFRSVSNGVEFKSFGDSHSRAYDNLKESTILFGNADGTENDTTYFISIYPSDSFFEHYTTNTPIYAAVAVALVLGLCAATFFLYDYYMRAASRANEAVLETKRRFVRFISHEIRTPLNAVHLGLEALTAEVGRAIDLLLASAAVGAAMDVNMHLASLRSWLELSAELMGNSDSAVDVLDDLLNYDKIEMGTLHLEFSAVPIWEVVKSNTSSFTVSMGQKGIRFVVVNQLVDAQDPEQYDCDQFVVVGDAARLAQVTRNLVSNALKFTPRDGNITVSGKLFKLSFKQNQL